MAISIARTTAVNSRTKNINARMNITLLLKSSAKFTRARTLSTESRRLMSMKSLDFETIIITRLNGKNITTTTTVWHTNSDLTTSLSLQSNVSILYLLVACSIFMICVIFASICRCFRHNNNTSEYDITNQHQSPMYNMLNADKYSVTDKESESSAAACMGQYLYNHH
ncbi:unnamed protein product [Rotaria socialis]|uniref:Uncharacterized protein n=1 Tax=Rotaria socialis TaxID=392032 RepID=A0A820FEP7_9BILA|nr:unnamed protein product [Rotaria socialis]CAF4260964.1 unnamed protein product [Rotaria socialis]CAF4317286.1 unnamed protein product [Rotaria socialis]